MAGTGSRETEEQLAARKEAKRVRHAAYMREYMAKLPPERRALYVAKQRERGLRRTPLARSIEYQNGKERQKDYDLQKAYGLTLVDYRAMVAAQAGVCAICTKPCSRSLSVDHCHTTGKIRGLLCIACNKGLGFFKDSTDLLAAAAGYLQRD